jgi:hypothetical protein
MFSIFGYLEFAFFGRYPGRINGIREGQEYIRVLKLCLRFRVNASHPYKMGDTS